MVGVTPLVPSGSVRLTIMRGVGGWADDCKHWKESECEGLERVFQLRHHCDVAF